MALGEAQKVTADVGSEELKLVRLELNKLLDAFDTLAAASQEADFASFKTAAAAIDTTTLRKIVAALELPKRPSV